MQQSRYHKSFKAGDFASIPFSMFAKCGNSTITRHALNGPLIQICIGKMSYFLSPPRGFAIGMPLPYRVARNKSGCIGDEAERVAK